MFYHIQRRHIETVFICPYPAVKKRTLRSPPFWSSFWLINGKKKSIMCPEVSGVICPPFILLGVENEQSWLGGILMAELHTKLAVFWIRKRWYGFIYLTFSLCSSSILNLFPVTHQHFQNIHQLRRWMPSDAMMKLEGQSLVIYIFALVVSFTAMIFIRFLLRSCSNANLSSLFWTWSSPWWIQATFYFCPDFK